MSVIIDQAMNFISAHLGEILSAVALALVGFIWKALKNAEKEFKKFVVAFAEEAKKTPGAADDVGAAVLKALAATFETVVESGPPKK